MIVTPIVVSSYVSDNVIVLSTTGINYEYRYILILISLFFPLRTLLENFEVREVLTQTCTELGLRVH